MDRRLIPVLFAVLLGAAPVMAQMRGGVSTGHPAGGAHVSGGHGFGGSVHLRGERPFRRRGGFFPGYWYPYPDYGYEDFETVEAGPTMPGVTVVQAPAPAAPVVAAEPLLLEW